MKVYTLPLIWDAGKFATRYGLNPIRGDFYVDGDGRLVVFPVLPDNPPIFDAPDDPLVILRQLAKAFAADAAAEHKLLRAALFVLVDELNLRTTSFNALLAAVAAATSLADLKTRVAAITPYPTRTMQQAITAVTNKIDSGAAD